MSEIHELIVRHGRQAAADISPRKQRTHIEIAARILEEESNALGITYRERPELLGLDHLYSEAPKGCLDRQT